MTEFYLQDGISRASSVKQNVIYINKMPVPVRFMEITKREAFQKFANENPYIAIDKSSFYALKFSRLNIIHYWIRVCVFTTKIYTSYQRLAKHVNRLFLLLYVFI